MDTEILLSLIMLHVENKLSEHVASGYRGPRGLNGLDGVDGKDGRDGVDGINGIDGRDGKDGASFNIKDHEETLKEWISQASFTFDSLTLEQKEEIRGHRGKDGKDGNSFNLEDHRDTIQQFIKDHSLKFSDLSMEEIETLRGPRGKDGRDGSNFNLEESLPAILEALSPMVEKLCTITEERAELLRGPAGRDGKDGSSFKFEDHEHEIWDLLQRAVSNSSEEFKLKFSDLSEDEVDCLKLKFSDLTDAERESIKGERGPRGPRGQSGRAGADGKHGLNGLHGKDGKNGINGKDGKDGINGQDAPHITDARILVDKNFLIFRFYFSDGSYIDTNKIDRPKDKIVESYIIGGGGGGGSGTGGNNTVIILDDVTTYGPRKEIQFSEGLTVEADGPDRVIVKAEASVLNVSKDGTNLGEFKTLNIGEGIEVEYDNINEVVTLSVPEKPDPNVLLNYTCDASVFVGAVVFLYKGIAEALLLEWRPMEIADPLNFEIEFPQVGLANASIPSRSHPIGICVNRYFAEGREKCDIRRFGSVDGYTGLDVSQDYFLSETDGVLVSEEDLVLNTGSYKVRVGQPISEEVFHFNRGDRHLV